MIRDLVLATVCGGAVWLLVGDGIAPYKSWGLLRWVIAGFVALLVFLVSSASHAQQYAQWPAPTPRELHSNPALLDWIPATCCVTNDCCWEIAPEEIRPVKGDNMYEVRSTGQVKKADWSKDGRYYRCACDYDNVAQVWNRHQGANTRCIFVPIPNS